MLLDAFLNPIPVSVPDPRTRPDRACAGHDEPEVFFPTRAADVAAAVAICADCPVKALCGAFAAESQEWGVWGGQYLEWGVPVVKRPVGRPRKTSTGPTPEEVAA